MLLTLNARFGFLMSMLFLVTESSFAQSGWNLVNAISAGNDCYQLTKNKTHQIGAAWSNKMLNLNKPFELYFQLNFGPTDNGADGMAVVLQTSSAGLNAIGDDGYQLGYGSLYTPITPSLDIEFDTYENTWPAYDISDDHCAINGDGLTAWELASAVTLLGSGVNIEDNLYHLIKVTWQPATTTLQVYFDCNLIQTLVMDMVTGIFNGDSMVYYGITGATGLSTNAQFFCELRLEAGADSTFCPGSPVTLNGNSNFTTYSWSPATGLSCTNCLNPVADPAGSTTYILTGNFGCLTATDTMDLTVDCVILPIELKSFAALCENNKTTLNWTTSAEFNNDYFIAERSPDAVSYQMVATIEASGNSSAETDYSFTDPHPLPGTNYYRLKQVDFDGTFTYSGVQSVTCNTTTGLFIHPNPAYNEVHLQIQSALKTNVTCLVTSISGKIIFQQAIKLNEGNNDILLPEELMTPGIYDVAVVSSDVLLHSLLVVQ
ncbi:MAG: L-type lectin-domain containing protein [Chitinophagales bacterium]